jgi:hypothetical protein
MGPGPTPSAQRWRHPTGWRSCETSRSTPAVSRLYCSAGRPGSSRWPRPTVTGGSCSARGAAECSATTRLPWPAHSPRRCGTAHGSTMSRSPFSTGNRTHRPTPHSATRCAPRCTIRRMINRHRRLPQPMRTSAGFRKVSFGRGEFHRAGRHRVTTSIAETSCPACRRRMRSETSSNSERRCFTDIPRRKKYHPPPWAVWRSTMTAGRLPVRSRPP